MRGMAGRAHLAPCKNGRPAHVRRHAFGFTLLEVLVSVSLLALMITLAYGSLRVAAQASRSGERLIDRTEQLRTAQAFLRRQLSQMLPFTFQRFVEQGVDKRFEGEAHKIQFVAPMPGYLSRGGAHVQALELVRDHDGYRLEFRYAQLNGFDGQRGFDPEREPVVLLDHIREGRFRFRRIEEDGQLGDWHDNWELPGQLPLLVRLEIEFEPERQQRWPEFDVAVLTATSNQTLTFSNMAPQVPVGPSQPLNPRPREAP